ncbi:CAC2 [Candida pseudojiufengensis]|uniref:CAC2 n=1 Tax=Candida pseudojiufengensis TaxID=497109 RepID=UPI002225533C|nr:CAC2 [Candida pseudojiufengensis]KAI5964276.1 CAC2 [Candida pseudojiufengensis]
MDATTIAVHWHDENKPIYSVDFQPTKDQSKSLRLATAGGDNNVRIWKVIENSVEYLSTLIKHTQAVNVVRFNPRGDLIATAGDDGHIFLWKKSETIIKDLTNENDDELKESWQVVGNITIGTELVDLCWCENNFIAVGSMDNVLRIFRIREKESTKYTGTLIKTFEDNDHILQGVTYSNKYLFTQSADRTVTIYKFEGEDISKVQKFQKIGNLQMYQPENLQSFFRRLKASPDGSLLVTPAGLDETTSHCVYIYSINNLPSGPIARLTGFTKPAVAISFSPVKYNSPSLPYSMIFAVATLDSVLIYSTEDDFKPLGQVSNLHYQAISDLVWDKDGSRLIIGSIDGFCSIVNFNEGAFNTPITEVIQLDDSISTKTPLKESTNTKASPTKANTPTIDSFFNNTKQKKDKKEKKRITPTLIPQ